MPYGVISLWSTVLKVDVAATLTGSQLAQQRLQILLGGQGNQSVFELRHQHKQISLTAICNSSITIWAAAVLWRLPWPSPDSVSGVGGSPAAVLIYRHEWETMKLTLWQLRSFRIEDVIELMNGERRGWVYPVASYVTVQSDERPCLVSLLHGPRAPSGPLSSQSLAKSKLLQHMGIKRLRAY